MPIPPPPSGGPPPAPTFSQVSSSPSPPKQEVSKARSALLSDICRGPRLKRVEVVNDRSAPLLHSRSPTAKSPMPVTDHPYIRLYQYLHQNQPKQPEQKTPRSFEQPRGGEADGGPAGSRVPSGGVFSGGLPKLRPVGDGSSGCSPSSRAVAPRPPSHHLDEGPTESSAPQEPPSSCLPPPAVCRRANAPPPPSTSSSREQPVSPNHTPPLPTKHLPSPVSSRCPPSSGGKPASSTSLAPPPPLHLISNGPTGSGEGASELPQRHNSLGTKRPAPSPGGSTRGPAPAPPTSPVPQNSTNRPPPPLRETPLRGAAPPVPAQPSRASVREAPPPPPYRTHGSPSPSSDHPARGKPPPPPSRTPAAPPPPPPPLRNGHSSSIPPSCMEDFESKYSFHPLDDFPPPEEYRHFTKIYPSRANKVMRGAPPLPPVGR